ncbi:YigZ family protein [Tolumonas osonensis]|uniref:Putative YigZ family protein n=1 Tax=Tolumonas osonensis TaxID=675874 RepID=A0A841GGA2_9GAMM|nr:YigZ family protein [Tolumonas osonensis]MBB6055706.1 putative YigZ family protein [Tolumonas osonensis]
MSASYNIPAAENQFEFEIKRSQFISYAAQASNRQAADTFIRSIRDMHPQARHVCWAYIAGAPNTTEMSMSDDGEPSGTAGRPMLKILQHSGLGEIVVAVVRYYGGIKLGTGGLQRAYSDAVSGVLDNLSVKLKVPRTKIALRYDYALESPVRHVLSRYDTAEEEQSYDLQVAMTLQLATAQLAAFRTELTNHCAGAVEIMTVNTEENLT